MEKKIEKGIKDYNHLYSNKNQTETKYIMSNEEFDQLYEDAIDAISGHLRESDKSNREKGKLLKKYHEKLIEIPLDLNEGVLTIEEAIAELKSIIGKLSKMDTS